MWVMKSAMTLLHPARRSQRETGGERMVVLVSEMMAALLSRALLCERWAVEVEASRILATRRPQRSGGSWRQK